MQRTAEACGEFTVAVIHATRSLWLISASQSVKVFLFGICKVVLLEVLFNLVVCVHTRGRAWIWARLSPKVSFIWWVQTCRVRVCVKRWSQLVTVPVYSVWMRSGSNCVRDVRDHHAQTRRCTAVVFGQPSLWNQNTAVHYGCWSWKPVRWLLLAFLKLKTTTRRVHCAWMCLHRSRDTTEATGVATVFFLLV